MHAYAQTPDLSLPALPDMAAGLDVPTPPMAAEPVTPPVAVTASTNAAAPSDNKASQPQAAIAAANQPAVGNRASADALDDLLPGLPAVPVVQADEGAAAPTTNTAASEVAALKPLPETPKENDDEPVQPMSLKEEAAAKGVVPPPLVGLPPMPETSAQALLSGQPLITSVDDEPEIPKKKEITRKRGIRDLPKLKPTLQPVRHAYNYQRVMLPPSLYKREYSPENRHLPQATTREDYDRQLFGVVAANDVNSTRAFLDLGKNVNLENATGETLLMTAVRYGAVDTMRLLLARGADPRQMGSNGMTALQLAEASGQRAMVEVLLARGA